MKRKKKSPFVANPKAAIAFAVAILLAAMIGAPILTMLAPTSSGDDYDNRVAEGPRSTGQSVPPQPVATWEDDGSPNFVDEEKGLSAEDEIFGDFALEKRDRDSASEAPPQPRVASSGSEKNPRITSGAAPGAPKLQAPGERRETGNLQVIG